MILDAQLQFSNKQALAAGPSENVVDLGLPRNIGVGENVYLFIGVSAPTTGETTVTVEASADEAFTAPVVAQTVGVIPTGAPAGSRLIARLQPDQIDSRFIRLAYAGGTAGEVTAAVVCDIDAYTNYEVGFTVS